MQGYQCSTQQANYQESFCPRQTYFCGTQQVLTLTKEGSLSNTQSRYGFFNNKVCTYEVKAQATQGFIYVKVITLEQAKVTLAIADSLQSQQVITCDMQPNEIYAAKLPSSVFLSFRSKDSDTGRFFFQTSFSAENTETNLANKRRCSDQGLSV